MSSNLAQVVARLVDRLIILASEDPELRSQLRHLAEAVLEATQSGEAPPAELSASPPDEVTKVQEVSSDAERIAVPVSAEPVRSEPPEPLPELTLGRSVPRVEPTPAYYSSRLAPPSDADLAVIERRCRVKAEGARWAASRRRLLAEGAVYEIDIEPVDREIIAKAKSLPDCFLWMSNPTTAPSPGDLRQFETVARCFEAVAEILTLLRQILNEPDQFQNEFEQCLDLLAEAQSALRQAIIGIDGPTDTDQMQVYNWLKATASEQQIFIQRYMRASDPADPSKWEDLAARIEDIDSAMQGARHKDKHRRKLMNKIRHKLTLIADDPEGAEAHWEILVSTVDELVSDGLPPSNRELRELLVPVIEELPPLSEIPQGFELVLREIDRFLATAPASEAPSSVQPSSEVQQVAELLRGKSMVLIGGERRRGSEQNLKEAFNLRELIWIGTREHQSIDGFEPYVARPEVAVVLLAIRWSSHSHGDVKEFCARHDKPLVRLPTGYSPNQVAVQILSQCSDRLREG